MCATDCWLVAVDYRRTRVVLHKNITSPCVHVSISEREFRVRTEASHAQEVLIDGFTAIGRPSRVFNLLGDRANAASRVPFRRWRAAPRVRCSRPRCAAHVIVACFALTLLYCIIPLSSYSSTAALRPLTVRATPAERSNMHGHNFSAPAAQSDRLRPVAAPQGWG